MELFILVSTALLGVLSLSFAVQIYGGLQQLHNKIQNFWSLTDPSVKHSQETLLSRHQSYNSMVSQFNSRLKEFPDQLVAKFLDYQLQETASYEQNSDLVTATQKAS